MGIIVIVADIWIDHLVYLAPHIGKCTCVYLNVENKYIICDNCCKCKKCNNKLDELISKYEDIDICKTCREREKEKEKEREKEKLLFRKKWKSSTPSEKLNFYGIIKLRKLASKKNIKGRSKMSKEEIISSLIPLVNEQDFPIN